MQLATLRGGGRKLGPGFLSKASTSRILCGYAPPSSKVKLDVLHSNQFLIHSNSSPVLFPFKNSMSEVFIALLPVLTILIVCNSKLNKTISSNDVVLIYFNSGFVVV